MRKQACGSPEATQPKQSGTISSIEENLFQLSFVCSVETRASEVTDSAVFVFS